MRAEHKEISSKGFEIIVFINKMIHLTKPTHFFVKQVGKQFDNLI
jgi:hypothetical protein